MRTNLFIASVVLLATLGCRHQSRTGAEPASTPDGRDAAAPADAMLIGSPVDAAPSALDAGSTSAPEPPAYRIVEIQPDKPKGSRIKIDKGSQDGINDTWRGHIIDDVGDAVVDGELTQLQIMDRWTGAHVELSPTKVKKYKYVRMEPP